MQIFNLIGNGHGLVRSELFGFHRLLNSTRGPVLGIDVGTRHVGLALSDPERLISFPHSGFQRHTISSDARRLQKLARSMRARCAVVGMPQAPHGGDCKALQTFIRLYSERVLHESGFHGLAYWDESYTSVIATETFMTNAKKSERNNHRLRKRRVDAVSTHKFSAKLLPNTS